MFEPGHGSGRFFEVASIGETMVVVAPTTATPLESAESFRLGVGGAESNVIVHLTQLGHQTFWASLLGSDPLGARIRSTLSGYGVSLEYVHDDPIAPTGVYFKDPGHAVFYYRRGSAASRMTPLVIDGLPLADTQILHLTGITPALSEGCLDMIGYAIEQARAVGCSVSFDVNFRAQLWPSSVAAPILKSFCRMSDLVFVGLDEANALWGTSTAEQVRALLHDVPTVVVKDESHGATEFTAEGVVFVSTPFVEVVEAIGAGDAFAAGYLSAGLKGLGANERLAGGHERAQTVLGSTSDIPDVRKG